MSNIQTVNFHNQTLSTLEIDNVHYVAMKPICENIGLNWNAQFERIKRDEVLSSTVRMTRMVAEDGKNRELVCLPIQYLNGWLFGIDVSRVKAEIKDKLIMYKKECYQVLHDYWTKGVAFNPRLTSEQTLALRDAVNMATGVLKLDYSTIYKMIHQRFNVGHIKELSVEQLEQAVEYVHRLMCGSIDDKRTPAYHDKDVQFIMYYMPELFNLIKHQVCPALRLIQSPLAGRLMGLATETVVHVNVLNRLALNDGMLTLNHVQHNPVKI